jgi:hypothetical protein
MSFSWQLNLQISVHRKLLRTPQLASTTYMLCPIFIANYITYTKIL